MYRAYWQLQQKPFEAVLDPAFYYPGESHQAAMLKLRYAIESRGGGSLLSGPFGCGKSLLVRMLRQSLGECFTPFVHLVFPQMSTAELLAYLAGELAGSPVEGACPGLQESIRRIESFLIANARQQRHAVVVIDEAQLLDQPRTLEALRLLLNFQSDGQSCLTLLLVGQTGVLPLLERSPQLEERLCVKCLMRNFSSQETACYVQHRLKVAGARREIFTAEALTTVYQLSHGVARRINRLCDLALLIAYAEGQDRVSPAQLEAVHEELVGAAVD